MISIPTPIPIPTPCSYSFVGLGGKLNVAMILIVSDLSGVNFVMKFGHYYNFATGKRCDEI
jgi:hypothetical protein